MDGKPISAGKYITVVLIDLVEFHVLTLGTNQKNHSTQLTQLGKLFLIHNYLKEIGVLHSQGGESTFKIDKVDTEDLKQFVVSE